MEFDVVFTWDFAKRLGVSLGAGDRGVSFAILSTCNPMTGYVGLVVVGG